MRNFLLGLGLGLAFISCGGGYVYHYYGLDMPADCYDKGKLLGKQGSNGWADENLSECTPDPSKKGKCWLLKSDEFFKAMAEIDKLRSDLSACEKKLETCK